MQTLLEELKKPSKYIQSDSAPNGPIDMGRVAAIILGGGQGTRLFPLTQTRCKPAISFGGRYHLIDVPISNAINSGCNKIFILTQFLSSSLHHHVFKTYPAGGFFTGFIKMLPAEEKPSQKEWFQGTADAVRQNLYHLFETPVDYFLILSGDQLYHMNYQHLLNFARKTDADLVVAARPTSKEDAKRMGLLKVDNKHFVTDFCEKPQEDALLKKMILSQKVFKNSGHAFDKETPYLGSMGIYLFKRDVLFNLLEHDLREDFGKHLIPYKVKQGGVAAFVHQDYWEDIGTIESFYKANLALTDPNPLFDLFSETNPIFSVRSNLPGPRILDSYIDSSIISEGCMIDSSKISRSILGPRITVKKGTVIKDSYIMGNDFYRPPIRTHILPEELYIGENCTIQKTIIDKHVHIGHGVKLVNKNNLQHYNGEDIYIRDGIIVVPKGVTLRDGFTL